MNEHQRAALAAVAQLSGKRSDPLDEFSFTSPDGHEHIHQREAIQHLIAGHETQFIAGNQGGKTWSYAAFFTSLAEGRSELAGLQLPIIPQPSVGWVLVQTREQQVESTQAAILAHLGDWPHVVKYSRQFPEAAQLILVKPIGGSSDPRRWSRIWFHVEGSAKNTLPGGRVDWAWADEPPNIKRWREVRFRGRGNARFFLGISMTPLDVSTWRPLKRDFEHCEGKVVGGRISIRAAVFDNPFLSESHKRGLVDKAKNDVHEMARLYGAYVDETGSNPFDRIEGRPLDRWQARARDPKMRALQVWAEIERHDGTHRLPFVLEYEEWWSRELDESYYALADPSLGINDGKHDPAAIHVYARRRPRLVARWSGFVPPWGLGWLGALMCARYVGDDGLPAWFDIEDPDGLGAKVVSGARAAGHTRFAYEVHEDRTTGLVETSLGWKTTTANRGVFIGSVQSVLMEDSIIVPSRGVIDTLRSVTYNKRGKLEGEGDEHDEDMILLGRFAHMARILGQPVAPVAQPSFHHLVVQELGPGFALPKMPSSRGREDQDWGPGL